MNKVVYTDDVTVIEAQNLNDIQDAIIRIDPADDTGKSIPQNADLNTYTTPGLYYCPNAATAATLINSPGLNAGFSFVVLAKGTLYQTQLINSGGYLYYRQRNSGGWDAWYATVHKEGDTFTGDVTINDASSTTSSEVSVLTLGNSTATGTVGNSNGAIRMYGQGDKYLNLRPVTTSGSYTSANRTIYLPDAGGTLALTSDIQIRTVTVNFSVSASGQFNTNLYTVINNDLPSGKRCLGIVGFTTNHQSIVPVAIFYADTSWSFQVRNLSSSALNSQHATIYYLASS